MQGEEWPYSILAAARWLREIAWQLAILNEGSNMSSLEQQIRTLEYKIDRLTELVQVVIQKEDQIMATEADFQAKLDIINSNTTASAAAAQALAKLLNDLKATITDAGLSATKEAEVLAKLGAAADTSTALKTFLEATAAGGVVGPEPGPVPTPTPVP